MEKTFQLEPKELQFYSSLEQEQQQALAQVGALSLDLEAAKTSLQTVQERHRSFIRTAVLHRGIDQFHSARITQGQLHCSLPDVPPELPPPAPDKQLVNGAPL